LIQIKSQRSSEAPDRRRRDAEYERLKETFDVLGEPDLMKQIRDSEACFASGKKGLSFEEVLCDTFASG